MQERDLPYCSHDARVNRNGQKCVVNIQHRSHDYIMTYAAQLMLFAAYFIDVLKLNLLIPAAFSSPGILFWCCLISHTQSDAA